MRDIEQTTQLIGYVQVHIGSKVFALPVQSVRFDRDVASAAPGGFFAEDGQFGILVDRDASAKDIQAQIVSASEDAVRHISKKLLN